MHIENEWCVWRMRLSCGSRNRKKKTKKFKLISAQKSKIKYLTILLILSVKIVELYNSIELTRTRGWDERVYREHEGIQKNIMGKSKGNERFYVVTTLIDRLRQSDSQAGRREGRVEDKLNGEKGNSSFLN